MSIKQEIVEFAVKRLGKKAATKSGKEALEEIVARGLPAEALAVKIKAAAAKKTKPVVRAPAIVRARSGTPKAAAADVRAEAAKPSKGAPSYADWRAANPDSGRLFDMSGLSAVPDVPQNQMPRVNPPKGPSQRIVDALGDPAVARGLDETVERGIAGGGWIGITPNPCGNAWPRWCPASTSTRNTRG